MKWIVILFVLFCGHVQAQELKQTAQEHFNNQQWEAALANYQTLVDSEAADSSDLYNMAFCQMQLGDYESALANFDEAKSRGVNASFADFNLSKVYALMKDEAGMYTCMKNGVEAGMGLHSRFQSDAAFEPYRSSAKFQELLIGIKANTFPCMRDANKRHLDFWLGIWDVYFNGAKVGVNAITMADGGCAIHESYTTAGDYSGQSINYFDPVDQLWHQHWVGTGGDVYNYIEVDRAEGMLQFESDFIDPSGNIARSRLTFTLNDDGTVGQLFENSYDEGQSWTSGFNGLYKRQE